MSDSEEARCDKFDEVYLPFTEGELKKHFVPSESDHIAYYKKRLGKRNEHNERFWIVTTLKSLVDAHRGGNEALDHLLTGCIGEPPREYSDWRSALGEKYRLFFEVAMPAPQQYRAFLKDHYREVTLNFPLMMTPGPGTQYEGKTWVDAVLVGETGVAVLFEAKVLSDISCRVKYDFTRNQIARNIDVMLERGHGQSGVPLLRNREPLLTYFVLLTPVAREVCNSSVAANYKTAARPAGGFAASPAFASGAASVEADYDKVVRELVWPGANAPTFVQCLDRVRQKASLL